MLRYTLASLAAAATAAGPGGATGNHGAAECEQALASACGKSKNNVECLACASSHQHQLRAAGCTSADVKDYCDASAGNGGIRGDFDLYVLAQSWQPEFCHGKSMPGCHPNASAYMHSHLTLHGLWPQYATARHGETYPFNCSQEAFNPLVLDQVPGGRAAILEYWPNVKAKPSDWSSYTGFCKHEWDKHGTCTALSQLQYFSAALAKLKQEGTPQLISNNIGKAVNKLDLQQEYGGLSMVSLGCGGGAYLSQVMTCWALDKTTHLPTKAVACPAAVLKEDTCAHDTITISDFSTGPDPPPPTPPPESKCVAGEHGPPCTSDAQCTPWANCVRCAHSGYCTDVPPL